ncbi:uncharacterized protein LOC141893218 [Acropora palmata]|uniref:uncharacterized protein LOC141893218 n=1 Tax=Acropora palmata TaxID=6131 RepID=UPI003DA073E9
MNPSIGKVPSWIFLVLVVTLASLHSSVAQFPWTKEPTSPMIVVEGVNNTNVRLEWDYDAAFRRIIVGIKIFRKGGGSEKLIARKSGEGTINPTTLDLVDRNQDGREYEVVEPATLVLKDVNNNEEYEYVISVDYFPTSSSPQTIDSKSVFVEVKVPPKITTKPLNTRSEIGANVTLTCEASGDPLPNITWTREGATTNQLDNVTGPSFDLVAVRLIDAGSYRCTAENGYGTVTEVASVSIICTTQCNTSTVGIRITEGAVWVDSLANLNSAEFSGLANNLTVAISSPYSRPENEDKRPYQILVKEFSRGSVRARVEMEFPSTLPDPLKPLRDAMQSGKLGMFTVDRELVINPKNLSEIFGGCRKQVLECTEEASSYKDITDGTLYKNFYKEVHSESGDRTCCHLSLMISTDGAPVFKSIHCSIWPPYLCILELPSQKRYSVKNVLLIGLWYGVKKPKINSFLEGFLCKIGMLETEGLLVYNKWEDEFVTFKVHLHCCICDLPGKALVFLHKLYNGLFGCMVCFHPGVRLAIRGNVRVYPYAGDQYEMRTSEATRQHALLAQLSGTDVFGVKGFSVLHNYMSVPDGCPVDYMHCILQGTGKWILSAIVDSKNKDLAFFIDADAQRTINAKLQAIAVPHDMERKPRSLEYIKRWKATEMQHFLLYFGLPLLKGILDDDHFHHLALLTTGLWIFLKNEISKEELALAGEIMRSFCRLMEPLYGERSETINVHSITHLEERVKCLGPLWTHSAFAFEAMIAHTLTGFKGTRGVAEQLCRW